MPQYQEFLISDMRTAKYLAKDRWIAPDDAFPTLLNAEVEKGIITRRKGSSEFADIGTSLPIVGFNKIAYQGYNEVIVCDTLNVYHLHQDGAFTALSAVGWTDITPVAGTTLNWYIAVDSDGSFIVAASATGRIYTSSNSGGSWTERQPDGDADKNWKAVACDDDGSHIIACQSTGKVFTSADSGATWTERQPNGASIYNWEYCACDSDGSVMMAVMDYGGGGNTKLFISVNSGVDWTERQPKGSAETSDSMSVACSADGAEMIAAYNGGRVWISTNTGAAWTEKRPVDDADHNWRSCAIDADGSAMMACIYVGRVYGSSDSGATWSNLDPTGSGSNTARWVDVNMDSDGSVMVAVISASSPGDNTCYYSTDSGATWTMEQTNPGENMYMAEVDCDSDGSHLFASSRVGSSNPTGVFRRTFLHTGDEDDYYWFQEYNGSLYMCNGRDQVFKHTPNYSTPYNVSLQPINTLGDVTIQTCRMLFVAKNRLIFIAPVIGGVWYPDRIYWTDVNLDTVSSANWVRAQQDITPMSGGYIGETPAIFSLDGSIWHINYTQNVDTPFTFEKHQQFHGGRARMSTVEANNALATFALTRMIQYDGHTAQDFDEKIRGFYDTLDDGKILYAYGHRMLDRNFAGWAHTRSGQTDHDRILWYNIDDDNFSDSDIAAHILFSVKGPWLPEGTSPGNFYYPIRDEDFQEYEFAGTKDGRVLRINTGYQDEGVNIATDIRSAQLNPFQRKGLRCAFGWVKFLISGVSGEGITVSFYKNDQSSAFKTIKIDSEGVTKNWQTAHLDGEVGDFFTMKIVNSYENGVDASAPFKIYGMMFGFAPAEPIRNRTEYSV